MAVTDHPDADLTAAGVTWDLGPLLGPDGDIDTLLAQAEEAAAEVTALRGRVAELGVDELVAAMGALAEVHDALGRAGHYAMLRFSEDTGDPARGAELQRVQERSTRLSTELVFFDLEWAEVDDGRAESLLADERLAFCAHHLRRLRRYRPHLLTEPEERVLSEKSVAGAAAWVRLFEEQTSAIAVELPATAGGPRRASLEEALSLLQHPFRDVRRDASAAVTEALAPGLRTRAYIFNTLMLDKSVEDRLRRFPTWISSRNLANEASDESVRALVDAVVSRYDIPQRWYGIKARALGLDRLADYDRSATVAATESRIGWSEATRIVRQAYRSFSPELAEVADRFLDRPWIHAPVQEGKRPGAFCAYTVASHHPYVLLNWTSRTRDVLTLAHELGHGVHAYLARQQGIFHQSTPLTLAETASVFGETVTNKALLATMDDPQERFALLAGTMDDAVATVFRQVAMNRFEDACHTARREEGELSADRLGELWAGTQAEMLGDAVELTEGYRTWWSYIPHFIATPGYVYAYAYGQLLALSVYARYEAEGEGFVPAYLELLRAGGSRPPEELGRIVGCDLADPGFWVAGLEIVDRQLAATEEAAGAAGRI
jgi:oligoendopeptidase F